MKFTRTKKLVAFFLILIGIGFLIPQHVVMPVQGADKNSYNSKSFWYYPWGRSGTHKGVDIFGKEGTNVGSATGGVVVFSGEIAVGGKVVLVLGPKWRLHYYAHLNEIKTSTFSWLSRRETIGTVGTTGNARGKTPHLHYSIITIFPYLWRWDDDRQGWKKIFYLDPISFLKS